MIPFKWMPGSWGLKGKTYKIAKAEYELTGKKLEKKLLEIEYEDELTSIEYFRKKFALQFKHGEIDENTYQRLLIPLDFRELDEKYQIEQLSEDQSAPVAYFQEKLELDYKHGRVKESEYLLQKATNNNQPYVRVEESGFDFKDGPGGFWMSFEWNDQFIDFLREHGYTGFEEQEIVDAWLSDIYRSQILETELGEHDEPELEPDELRIEQIPLGDGRIAYE